MLFQIKEIILWPKNKNFQPRRLKFEIGQTNVITGASRTGKSAIIPIVDYCLGSDSCSIPVTTIRDACEWFGVLIQTRNGEKLFARREPGNQQATGDMFMLEGDHVEIPSQIKVNTNVLAVKLQLDQLVGLTNLSFDTQDTGSGFLGRPSFRDLSAFIFQPQNIIANYDILFYKADTYEHREKLKTIFPYVLGAVSPEILAMQHELGNLRGDIKKKQSELQSIRNVSERWIAEIKSKYSESRELGLLDITYKAELDKDGMLQALKTIISSPRAKIEVTEQSIENSLDELAKIVQEETLLSTELVGARKRFSEMTELRKNASAYTGTLATQSERLKISEWFFQHDKEQCPICGNDLSETTEELQHLRNSLTHLDVEIKSFEKISPSFDREFERIRAEIRNLTDALKGLQLRRTSLEQESDVYRQRQYETARVERFIGNLEKSIEIYESLGVDSELANEINQLQERINELLKSISERDIKSRTEKNLNKIHQYAGRLLPNLDVERPNDPIVLKIRDLALQVQSNTRFDYLWEIGSGSNWLAYHIALILALHQFFLEDIQNPVPGFLIIDQPSQVYFPKKLAERNKDSQEKDYSKELVDEDASAVRMVFKVIADVVNRSNKQLQVIVLDHAAENIWGNIDGIYLVDEWRDGNKLVPEEWLL